MGVDADVALPSNRNRTRPRRVNGLRPAVSTHDPVTASRLLPDRELMRRNRARICPMLLLLAAARTPQNLDDPRRRLPRRDGALVCWVVVYLVYKVVMTGRRISECRSNAACSADTFGLIMPERRRSDLVDRSPGTAGRPCSLGATRCDSRSARHQTRGQL